MGPGHHDFEILCGVTLFAEEPHGTRRIAVQYEDYSKHNRTSIYAGSRTSAERSAGQPTLAYL